MKTLLFFDLPSVTEKDKRNYRIFVKYIKSLGFIMMQESVYYKMSIDMQVAESTISLIKENVPFSGSVMVLTVTEKQFSNMEIIIGEKQKVIIDSDERYIEI